MFCQHSDTQLQKLLFKILNVFIELIKTSTINSIILVMGVKVYVFQNVLKLCNKCFKLKFINYLLT